MYKIYVYIYKLYVSYWPSRKPVIAFKIKNRVITRLILKRRNLEPF